jgi:hypothetical protein
MKPDELGKFVCVANCRRRHRTIWSDGIWVKKGTQFSSAHRACHESQMEEE